MSDFASTWTRGRRESGNSAEQWASDLRTISTVFGCVAVESQGGSGADAEVEANAELYNDLFQKMQRRVYSFEGTIRQFLVDDKGMVLIACFGLLAHENDAERATRCAMSISSALGKIGVASSYGVTTGEVFCGLVGGETRCEYALIGDAVNMAARLMASTQGEIRCDVETYTRSCKRVVFEHLDPISVKGKAEKVKVFKPLAGTVSAALSLRKIPLIGRDEEMRMVLRTIDAFADMGYSSAVIFEGESGMGKSRMLRETVERINRHKLPILPDRGAYETMPGDGTLSFIVAILKEIWQLKEEMPVDVRTQLVKAEVQKLVSPFALKHINLLEYVMPSLDFHKDDDASSSLPTSSVFSVLVRLVTGFVLVRVKASRTVLVCDNR